MSEDLGYMAGPPELRAEDFRSAWHDPDVDLIMSAIGGTSTHQILDCIEFGKLSKQPKLLVGYSDVTALLLALHAQLGVVSLVGPALLPQLGGPAGPDPFALESFLSVAAGKGEHPAPVATASYAIEPRDWTATERSAHEPDTARPRGATTSRFRDGTATGRLVVANLGVLSLLVGTPYCPDLRDAILLVEDDETERPWTVDRFFTHLKQAGVLEHLRGLVVSEFPTETGIDERCLAQILDRVLQGTAFPVIVGFPFGHVDPSPTIPMGVAARVSTHPPALELLEPAVEVASEP